VSTYSVHYSTKRTLKTIAGIKYNTQEAIDEVTQQRTKSGYK